MNYDRNRLQKLAFQAAENAHQDAKRNNTWFFPMVRMIESLENIQTGVKPK